MKMEHSVYVKYQERFEGEEKINLNLSGWILSSEEIYNVVIGLTPQSWRLVRLPELVLQ